MTYAGHPPRRHARHSARGLSLLPALLVVLAIAAGTGFVAYVLWPRWPGPVMTPDAPALPIVVGGTAFNVPQGAFRMPIQRHAGAQERVDLVFLWPSLEPPPVAAQPSPGPKPVAAPNEPPPIAADRIFVTLAPATNPLSPVDRLQSIYPRYLGEDTTSDGSGLVIQPFRPGTPYQNEDLVYAAQARERFFMRCSRPGPAGTPGVCLHEMLVGETDVTFRFPRPWIDAGQDVEAGIARLLANLRPTRD